MVGMGGSYLWAARTKRKKYFEGQQPGTVSKIVEEHPGMSGLLASLALYGVGKKIPFLNKQSSAQDLCLQKIDVSSKMSVASEISEKIGVPIDIGLFSGMAQLLKMFTSGN